MMRDPDFDLKVRALLRSSAKKRVTVESLKAEAAARRARIYGQETAAIKSFEPTVNNAPDARPATDFGAKDLAGDQFVVDDFTDSEGVTHHGPPSADGMIGGTPSGDGSTGSTATKGKDMSKCVEHAARIANIHAQSDFSEAAKSTAIRAANEQHAPECAGLCNQTGENASKAVTYNSASATQRVARFSSTNLPRRK